MEKTYYWNVFQECHPRNLLLRYSKSSKISREILQRLSQLRKIYAKLPPIVYSLQDAEENDGIDFQKIKKLFYCIIVLFIGFILESDIFGQQCNLPLKDSKAAWKPISFHVPDSIYKQLKQDLLCCTIDKDHIFLSLFPVYIDMNRKKQILFGHQHEEIFLPSTIPSTEFDLNRLLERFDSLLYNEQALEIGICEKRRRLYNDLFNELIRIITLECTERGLLFARVKNEFLQWMNTYEELYISGMAYALRQYLCKMEEKKKLEYDVQKLEYECEQLNNEIEKESDRFEKFSQLLIEDNEQTQQQNFLRNNVSILRSTNEILRRDVYNTLNSILTSPIFLGEPIIYDKEND